jgi:hypothetical protein
VPVSADDAVSNAVAGLEPIGLEELDARAALQRRVDRKYVLPAAVFAELIDELRADHDALEVADTRLAAYESVYFDTPDLRSFHDHVEDRAPRFKVRTRLYADSDVCSLELKIKREDGETDKRHVDYDPDDHGSLTTEAFAFLDRELRRRTDRALPDDLEPALTTAFRRATLVARDAQQRATVDVDLRLVRPDGRTARLPDDLVLVETKTPDGDGPCERLLRDAGVEEVSLSKYRTGIALLATSSEHATAAARSFRVDR